MTEVQRRPMRALRGLVPVALAVGVAAVALGPQASARAARGGAPALQRGVVDAVRQDAAHWGEALEGMALQAQRRRSLERAVRSMPDLTQTDPELGVPGRGGSYCGPVAVSNALVWWASQGFEDLLPGAGTERERQMELVRRLGSTRFMGTSANAGTGAAGLMTGLERYVESRGYRVTQMRYQGWRGHPRRFATGVKTPEADFMASALDQGETLFVNIGWYKPSRMGPYWRRRGGHWLTVVGHGVEADGEPAKGVFAFHDPAPWAGTEPAIHFARLAPLGEGFLLTEDGAFPSTGHHHLLGDVLVKHEGDVPVVDGVVAVALARQDS